MSIAELTQTKGYKNLMKYVYGWGAAVVLVGALFKIQHYPGASIMLVIGLLTEALIFFLSAFEPLAEELDWTLVFPELAGLTDIGEEAMPNSSGHDKVNKRREFTSVGEVQNSGSQSFAGSGSVVVGGAPVAGQQIVVAGGSGSALAKFDEMIEKAEINPGMFEKLGKGLANLNKTVEALSDTSSVGVAAQEFAAKVKTATESVSSLSDSYNKSTEAIKESVNVLSNAYVSIANSFNEANSQVAEAYAQFSSKLVSEMNSVGNLGSEYSQKLGGLNGNLAALNSVYEMQIQNMKKQLEASDAHFKGLDAMVENIGKSVEQTKQLHESVQKLEKNVASLNEVYGNMLSSLNIK